MVEVYLPFVLLIMSWNTADPGGTMTVSQRVFIDQETCLKAGGEFDEFMATVEETEGSAYTWRCEEQVREIEVFQREAAGQ